MNSAEMFNRSMAEVSLGEGSDDVMWISAMGPQMRLVDHGQALTYALPEGGKLPGWAAHKNQAYGTTYEAAVFIYNKWLVAPDEVPQDHAAFAKLTTAKSHKFKGKVTTYDIAKSGVGFMFVVQDAKLFPGMKELENGFGASSYRVYSSTVNMLEKVSSGEHVLGYNGLGSHALVRAKKDPALGVVLPNDYTLVLSRVMFIGKQAKNPNAAKLCTDYILSQRGQKLIGGDVELFSIRSDVDAEYTDARHANRDARRHFPRPHVSGDGGGGAGAAVSDLLPELPYRAVLRSAQDHRLRGVPIHLCGSGFLAGVAELHRASDHNCR